MEIIQPPLVETLGIDNKRHCIRIKARIKIRGEEPLAEPAYHGGPPYQAYCETVTSSRPQSPDIFTTPPTHSVPFQPAQASSATTYTARITPRRRAVSKVSTSTVVSAPLGSESSPTEAPIPTASDNKHHVTVSRVHPEEDAMSTNRYRIVSRTINHRGSHLEGTDDNMSRNRTPSLSQEQPANIIPRTSPRISMVITPLKQKRYGRMEYHPLPPVPPSPPESPVNPPTERQITNKNAVNFSRGEIKRKFPQLADDASAPHLARVDTYASPPRLPSAMHHPTPVQYAIPEHERPQSKASRRTVTFADDTTISSRSSSPDRCNHIPNQSLRQSKSFTADAQIPSSLRLYRSHDNLLIANNTFSINDISGSANRRTAPKDSKHKYSFGQRPAALMTPSPGLGRSTNPTYNPRLSTSKAQYRGLATLPRPLPSSLRVTAPQRDTMQTISTQTGPRLPPWGSLEELEEQRGKRMDKRERDQARLFRAQTLSDATTMVGSTDSFGKEAMRREVEGYRRQVVSVYPDMAFDGNAGKGGRKSCCCVVM